MSSTDFSTRRRFRLGPRHLLTIIAVLAICLAAVLLAPRLQSLFRMVSLHGVDLRTDVCVKERLNALGDIDVAGPIQLGRFKDRTSFGDEAAYMENVGKLVSSYAPSSGNARYVLQTAFWAGSVRSDALAFAALCQDNAPQVCRIREFRLRATVEPSQAALIAFENTIKANTGLRECLINPL